MGDLWLTLLLAAALTLVDSLLQDRIGLALNDEGYLWYGVLRTAAGERPGVDFQAYDPGRYHWCVAGARLLGPGLVALRRSTGFFQLLGLWAGLFALRCVVDSGWLLAAIGVLMTWWMQPRWKRFEHSMSILAVAGAFLLLEDPVAWGSFLAGVFVGLAAIMGRNHGLYTLAAFAALHLSLIGRVAPRDMVVLAGCWVVGIGVGYSPMLWTWARDREAFRRYLDGIRVMFRRRATNLTLPLPWPWTVPRAERATPSGLSRYLSSVLLLVLPLYHLGVLLWSPWAPETPGARLAVAASLVGVFYLHHAFSRADPHHLCQVTQPFVIGSVALGTVVGGDAVAGVVVVMMLSPLAYFTARPLVPAWRALASGVPYTDSVSRGERLRIPAADAAWLDVVRGFVDETLGPDETLFVAPFFPGLYPTLGRRAPVFNTYPLYPETEEGQARILADLEAAGVRCALLVDLPLDGRDDLRYRNTHPRVWQFVESAFEPVTVPGLPPEHRIHLRPLPSRGSAP